MTETIVKTPYSREITVTHNSSGIYLKSEETNNSKPYTQAFLSPDNAKEVGIALLEAAGEPVNDIGELPEVTVDQTDYMYLRAGKTASRRITADPAVVLEQAKSLFALAKELQKREDDKVAEQKAAEAAKAEADLKLNKRRDELVKELTGSPARDFSNCSRIFRDAIDKIIELETKVSQPKAVWASVPF